MFTCLLQLKLFGVDLLETAQTETSVECRKLDSALASDLTEGFTTHSIGEDH